MIEEIKSFSSGLEKLTDDELRAKTAHFRQLISEEEVGVKSPN